jgi:hypothetical protein
VSGSTLCVANYGEPDDYYGTRVGEYSTRCGTISANFITGLSGPFGLAINSLQSCVLQDTLSYNATSGTLTMKFLIGTPTAVIWEAWLSSEGTVNELFSVSRPVTNAPKNITQTTTLSPEGTVGVLSTLTTAAQNITCSSLQTINTGIP